MNELLIQINVFLFNVFIYKREFLSYCTLLFSDKYQIYQWVCLAENNISFYVDFGYVFYCVSYLFCCFCIVYWSLCIVTKKCGDFPLLNAASYQI